MLVHDVERIVEHTRTQPHLPEAAEALKAAVILTVSLFLSK
jgi:hypothetical protein